MHRSPLHTLTQSTLLFAIGTVLALSQSSAIAQDRTSNEPPKVKVEAQEIRLDNGMRLLLIERHRSPTVVASWLVHAGSANEVLGATGIAHLFEHMLFKGTTRVGTRDPNEEARLMADLDAVRDEMEVEYNTLREAARRGEIKGNIIAEDNQTARLKQLKADLTELQLAHREIIVKDEFDQIYTAAGGSMMNAFTSQDLTAYFIRIPANKLELWFWMESDRLLDPVFREFYSERDVVREERRLRVEADPVRRFSEQFDAMFWMSNPYHHPTVGWPSDVEAINRQQADDFFSTYYAPNNITAVLIGDIDPAEVEDLAQRYFGRIPRGNKAPPEIITEEIDQLAERRMHAVADTTPNVAVRWHTVAFPHPDAAALQVLAGILDGRTGRLYKSLVEERDLVTGDPYAASQTQRLGGFFEIGADIRPGSSPTEVEDGLWQQILRLQSEAPAERELERVKNQLLADSVRGLQSSFSLLIQLVLYEAMGDWELINMLPTRISEVSPEDISRVASTYLKDRKRNVLLFQRDESQTTGDAQIESLPEAARDLAKKLSGQIASLDDEARLRQLETRLNAGRDQVHPDLAPAIDLALERIDKALVQLARAQGEDR